jgi:hypothetical protein
VGREALFLADSGSFHEFPARPAKPCSATPFWRINAGWLYGASCFSLLRDKHVSLCAPLKFLNPCRHMSEHGRLISEGVSGVHELGCVRRRNVPETQETAKRADLFASIPRGLARKSPKSQQCELVSWRRGMWRIFSGGVLAVAGVLAVSNGHENSCSPTVAIYAERWKSRL